ncbi:MAG: hypothetical protein RL060_649 [Bacteroidota bacterium]
MTINNFNETEVSNALLASWAKALAHPARIAILQLLIQKQSCICGEIVSELPLSQSTVSQHLKAMKEAGLIVGTIDGPKVCYCINVAVLHQFATTLLGISNALEQAKNCDC